MTYVDFTKLRKGSRPFGFKVVVCPKCNRKGELRRYKKGGAAIDHFKRGGMFGMWEVTDYCYFKDAGEVAKL